MLVVHRSNEKGFSIIQPKGSLQVLHINSPSLERTKSKSTLFHISIFKHSVSLNVF